MHPHLIRSCNWKNICNLLDWQWMCRRVIHGMDLPWIVDWSPPSQPHRTTKSLWNRIGSEFREKRKRWKTNEIDARTFGVHRSMSTDFKFNWFRAIEMRVHYLLGVAFLSAVCRAACSSADCNLLFNPRTSHAWHFRRPKDIQTNWHLFFKWLCCIGSTNQTGIGRDNQLRRFGCKQQIN